MEAWRLAAASVATLGLILAAAKTHGRQIRLEREQHGIWKVDFRAGNDPWVEALWRMDRILFWVTLPVVLAGLVVLALWLESTDIPGWWAFAAALAFASCFIVAGLASSFRLLRAMRQGVPSAEWRAAGHRGSLLWWSITGILAVACAALLLLP